VYYIKLTLEYIYCNSSYCNIHTYNFECCVQNIEISLQMKRIFSCLKYLTRLTKK